MYTKTVTLAGEALSSFLAAGGQTVNPDAPSTANVQAAAAVTTTPSQVPFPVVATTAAAATTTRSPTRVPPATAVTTTSSTSTPAVVVPTTSSTLISSASYAAVSSRPASSRVALTTNHAVSVSTHSSVVSSARHSASSAVSGALSAHKPKSSSGGLSTGGIAGLVIGLILLFTVLGVGFVLYRKRKQREADEDSNRSGSRNEKGMVRLEESEISTPNVQGGQGFDFGDLPAIVPAAEMNYDPNAFKSNASPAAVQQGAALLGIKRPFTPPPGHPAHPNYKQPPAMAARQMQQGAVPAGHPVPFGSQIPSEQAQPVLRRPVAAAAAPMIQRKLSSNNPFSDPVPELAPPLARSLSPVSVTDIAPIAVQSNTAAERRNSAESFLAGDDSFESKRSLAAANAAEHEANNLSSETRPTIVEPTVDESPHVSPKTLSNEIEHPMRTKSVLAATDDWAARKAHLKNTLALHSNPVSPMTEQSPFADPAPTLDHEIAAMSPMMMDFEHKSGEEEEQ